MICMYFIAKKIDTILQDMRIIFIGAYIKDIS